MWYDITHNRYINIGISKYGHDIGRDAKQNGSDVSSPYDEKEPSLLEFDRKQLETIFKNSPIKVEVIYDKKENKVSFVVKDCGTGMTSEDVRYMSYIGTSKETCDGYHEEYATLVETIEHFWHRLAISVSGDR